MIQKIKITPKYPNQIINFVANNQNITIDLRFLGYINLDDEAQAYIDSYSPPMFYCSITCNNINIIKTVPVVNRQAINQYPSTMNGYIVPVNLVNNDNPNLNNLGNGCELYYVNKLEEVANI